jgi:hypothetical protein
LAEVEDEQAEGAAAARTHQLERRRGMIMAVGGSTAFDRIRNACVVSICKFYSVISQMQMLLLMLHLFLLHPLNPWKFRHVFGLPALASRISKLRNSDTY